MTADIRIGQEGPVGLLTLARPKSLNALSHAMILTLQNQLLAWQENPEIHAVILQAEPGKAFCAGGDVRWLYEAGLAKNPEQILFFRDEYRLNNFIHDFAKPYIVLMDGFTMGGGVGISLHGSHPVATENFVFSMPETGIGLFPDIGASYLLSRCPGKLGLYLALTGSRLNAAEACKASLVSNVVTADKLSEILPALLKLDLSHDANAQVTSLLQKLSQNTNNISFSKDIDECFSGPDLSGIFEKLANKSTAWSMETLAILKEKSPLSLEITFQQMQKAQNLSLAECLAMDYCLVQNFMKDSDFYEGIRAALIDKDKKPRWKTDFNREYVERYFSKQP